MQPEVGYRYCYLSNGYKVITVLLVVAVIAYGLIMDKFGKIKIHAQDAYKECK